MKIIFQLRYDMACICTRYVWVCHYRHPIFDRPQDLDVIIWTLDDRPCLCSSWVLGGFGYAPCLKTSRLECFVLSHGPNTCWFCLLRAGNGLLAIPTPHRPRPAATGPIFLLPAKGVGRSAMFLVGRPLFWSIGHFSKPRPFLEGAWPFWTFVLASWGSLNLF